MKKQDYHLKIHFEYFTLREGLDYFFLFCLIFGPFLFLWFFDFDKELIKICLEGLPLILLLQYFPAIPIFLSLYDRKKELFTTSIASIKSFEYKPLGGGSLYGDIRIPSKMITKFGIVSSEEDMDFFRCGYKIENKTRKTYVWAMYTSEKKEILKSLFLKMKLQRISYPFQFTYYAHGHILIDIDLVEDYDYPENFRKRFYEIKEMY